MLVEMLRSIFTLGLLGLGVNCFVVFKHADIKLRRTPVRHGSRGLLLQGIQNLSEADCYSENMDITEAAHLFNDPKHVYECAVLDSNSLGISIDEYTSRITQNSSTFISSKTLYDRQKLKSDLQLHIKSRGSFVCLLGGKFTGKSFLMKQLAQEEKNVFLVDLRVHKDILTGIKSEILSRSIGARSNELMATSIFDAIFSFVKIRLDSKKSTDNLRSQNPDITMDTLIRELVATTKGPPTFIIDEVNIEFSDTPDKIIKARDTLRLFTALTTQDNLVRPFGVCCFKPLF